MIKVGDKEIIDLKYGDKRVKKIYKGDDIIAYTLPDGYIELDYLESSNGDYIDTGFVPNVDIGIECKVQKRTESDYWVPFGTREYVTNSDGEETWCTIFLCDSPSSGLAGVAYKLRAGFCSSYINTSSHDITINDEVSIKLDKNTFLFHTQSSNNWIIGDGPNSPMTNYIFKRSILLFACWYRNSVLYAKPARFWYFKLYNSKTNELYRYYVPCISPEGIYGLYDLITETFYKNARTSGIDGFRGGVKGLPNNYTPLNYLQTDSAIIDTMIKPSVDLRIVTRYQDIGTNAYCILFGCIDTANKSNFYINDTPKGSDTDKTKYLLCFYYSNRGANLGYIDRDTIVSCLVDKNLMMCYNNKTQTVVSRQFQDVSSININYSICLFGVNYSGEYSYTKPYRFWYCKLYNTVTGEVYRNMIPCVNNNNEYGMYDTISKLFFTSAIQGRYFTGEIL